jgi:thiol:disulfide interchange protein
MSILNKLKGLSGIDCQIVSDREVGEKCFVPTAAGAYGIERATPFYAKIKYISAKLRYILMLATLAIPLYLTTLAATPHVTAEIIPAYTHAISGVSVSLNVQLDIAPGWHIYGENPGEVGVPTRITWPQAMPGLAISDMSWPTPSRFETAGIESWGYESSVTFPFLVTLPEALSVGDRVPFVAEIRWLACADLCIPGSATVTGSLLIGADMVPNPRFSEILGESKPVSTTTGAPLLWVMILSAFVGGLILNVMPCVFPVLSLKLFQLLPKSTEAVDDVQRKKVTLRHDVLAYASGIMVSFWVMAMVLLILRQTLGVVGWGIQLQYPVVVFGLMILFFVLALNFFGVFEIGLSAQKLGQLSGSHAKREFLSGVLIVLVATPCTAPFLGAAIGFALSQAAWVTLLVLTAMGLGLASPMVIVAFFPGLLRGLPKPGPWMVTVRQLLGFPMLASVIWLLWVLLQQWGEAQMVPLLGVLLGAAVLLWFVGVCQHRGRFRLGAIVLFLVIVLSGLAYRGLVPDAGVSRAYAESAFVPFSETTLQQALAAGRPVFVDVTAAWCLTCQVNKKTVLETEAAQAFFSQNDVLLLVADWTAQDDAITQYLASFGRSGVPMYVYYAPGKAPVVLPELLRMAVLEDLFSGAE